MAVKVGINGFGRIGRQVLKSLKEQYAGDLDVVRNILARLDVADLATRITTVYRLHNAPAVDVATAINNLLDRQRDLNQAAPVVVGMILSAAARARRRSLCGRSRIC